MNRLSDPTVAAPLVGFLLVLTIWMYSRASNFARRSRGLPLPPGPRGLPIIGNLLDIPKVNSWLGYLDLSRKYGNMVTLTIMGFTILVIDDVSIGLELLEKRSAKYSSRLDSNMAPLVGWDWNLVLMPYGERWRLHRRTFWHHFIPHVIPRYHPVQEKGARKLLMRLLASPTEPEKLVHHMRYSIGGSIIQIAYGLEIAEEDDKYINVFEQGEESLEFIVPGASMLEFFPFFARLPTWLPGTGTQRRLAYFRKLLDTLKRAPWMDAKRKIVAGTDEGSVASALMEDLSDLTSDSASAGEEVAMNVLGVTYGAGTDTQLSTLQAFFVAMALYPEVQKKAQAELDAVVGQSRLPELADREALLYVDAVLREALRWHTPLVLGIPHTSSEDDEYNGYFIPKDTAVMVNVWSIMHDPKTYPQPEEFVPERFLKDGRLDPKVSDPVDIVFGMGRRICPGRHYAEAALFINMASVLHTFNITPVLDDQGRPPRPHPTSGAVSYMEGCQCVAMPRSSSAEMLVRSSQMS